MAGQTYEFSNSYPFSGIGFYGCWENHLPSSSIDSVTMKDGRLITLVNALTPIPIIGSIAAIGAIIIACIESGGGAISNPPGQVFVAKMALDVIGLGLLTLIFSVGVTIYRYCVLAK